MKKNNRLLFTIFCCFFAYIPRKRRKKESGSAGFDAQKNTRSKKYIGNFQAKNRIRKRTYSSIMDHSILNHQYSMRRKKYSYWMIIAIWFFSPNNKNRDAFLFCSSRIRYSPKVKRYFE
jgi:hypothetical protein